MKQLQKLVVSPFFKRHSKTVELFDYLLKFHPDYKNAELKPEQLSAVLYPDEPYVSQRIRDVMSFLLEVAEHYLAFTYLKQNPSLRNTIIANQLYYHKIPQYLETEIKSMQKTLQQDGLTDVLALELQHQLARLQFSSQNVSEPYYHQFDQSPYHDVVTTWLQTVYTQLLEHTAEFFAHDSNDSLKTVLPPLLAAIEQIDFDKNALITRVNFYMYQLKTNPTAENYEAFKLLILEHKRRIPPNVMRKCLSALQTNLMVRAFKEHNLIYSDDYLMWKVIAVETELQLMRHLSPEIFFNMVNEYLKRNQLQKAHDFIEQYSPTLVDDDAFILNYTKAMVYFAEKDFDTTLAHLNKIEVNQLNALRFNYKLLFIMTLYELGQHKVALAHLDSFRHYVKKAKLLDDLAKSYYDFYKMTTVLIKAANKPANPKLAEKLLSYWKKNKLKPIMSGWIKSKIQNFLDFGQKPVIARSQTRFILHLI